MDQESFEELVKAKLAQGNVKAPDRVWQGVNAQLNEQAVAGYRSSQTRYRLVAAAAVLIAFFSFALNIELNQSNHKPEENISSSSYNALLPSSSEHFRFFDQKASVAEPDYRQSWAKIIFLDRKRALEMKEETPYLAQDKDFNVVTSSHLLDRIMPSAEQADVIHREVSPYYVAQYRSGIKFKRKQPRSFWAGVEAGTGNFTPEFNGTNTLNAAADYSAIAGTLGQSDFVNPSSSTSQSEMNDGVLTSFGIDFGVKMGDRWTLESGVQYASMNNSSIASVNIIDVYTLDAPLLEGSSNELSSARQTQVENTVDQTVSLDNRTTFTAIPLKAGYFLMDKKFSMRLNAGVTANYFLSNQFDDPSGQLRDSNNNDLYNEWSFDGLTGIEFGYKVFNNFNLTLEPNYIQSITPLSSSLTNRTGFMIQTGLRYNIE